MGRDRGRTTGRKTAIAISAIHEKQMVAACALLNATRFSMKGYVMIYEVREYVTVPGRMAALVKRNNEVSLPLFAKHDMHNVFMGVTEFGDNSNNELVYVLKWDSYEEMAQKWAAYMNDPVWIEAKATSEAGGPFLERIRRRFINPSSFM